MKSWKKRYLSELNLKEIMFEDASLFFLFFFPLWYSFHLLGHKSQFIRKQHMVSSIFLFFKEHFKSIIVSFRVLVFFFYYGFLSCSYNN